MDFEERLEQEYIHGETDGWSQGFEIGQEEGYDSGYSAGYDVGYGDALRAIDYVWLAENYRGVNYIFLDYDRAIAWFYNQLKERGWNASKGYVHSYDIDLNKTSIEVFTADGDLVVSLIPHEIKDNYV